MESVSLESATAVIGTTINGASTAFALFAIASHRIVLRIVKLCSLARGSERPLDAGAGALLTNREYLTLPYLNYQEYLTLPYLTNQEYRPLVGTTDCCYQVPTMPSSPTKLPSVKSGKFGPPQSYTTGLVSPQSYTTV